MTRNPLHRWLRSSRELPLPTDKEVPTLPCLLGSRVPKDEWIPDDLGTPELMTLHIVLTGHALPLQGFPCQTTPGHLLVLVHKVHPLGVPRAIRTGLQYRPQFVPALIRLGVLLQCPLVEEHRQVRFTKLAVVVQREQRVKAPPGVRVLLGNGQTHFGQEPLLVRR